MAALKLKDVSCHLTNQKMGPEKYFLAFFVGSLGAFLSLSFIAGEERFKCQEHKIVLISLGIGAVIGCIAALGGLALELNIYAENKMYLSQLKAKYKNDPEAVIRADDIDKIISHCFSNTVSKLVPLMSFEQQYAAVQTDQCTYGRIERIIESCENLASVKTQFILRLEKGSNTSTDRPVVTMACKTDIAFRHMIDRTLKRRDHQKRLYEPCQEAIKPLHTNENEKDLILSISSADKCSLPVDKDYLLEHFSLFSSPVTDQPQEVACDPAIFNLVVLATEDSLFATCETAQLIEALHLADQLEGQKAIEVLQRHAIQHRLLDKDQLMKLLSERKFDLLRDHLGEKLSFITRKNILTTYETAEKYQIADLKKKCQSFAQTHFLLAFESESHRLNELFKICLKILTSEQMAEIYSDLKGKLSLDKISSFYILANRLSNNTIKDIYLTFCKNNSKQICENLPWRQLEYIPEDIAAILFSVEN